MGMATGNVRALPKGVPAGALEQAGKDYDACQQHMGQIAEALLAYAREHDGVLPPANSWCDDIGPYVKPEANTPDLWRCPATPDLKYGYAINAELAGADIRILEGHESYVLLLHAKSGAKNEALRLPEKAEDCPHMERWGGQGQGKCAVMMMLNGDPRTVAEGQPFPQPPMPGKEQ
jgi:hypothetical protein